jgi:hypothetical protein
VDTSDPVRNRKQWSRNDVAAGLYVREVDAVNCCKFRYSCSSICNSSRGLQDFRSFYPLQKEEVSHGTLDRLQRGLLLAVAPTLSLEGFLLHITGFVGFSTATFGIFPSIATFARRLHVH